MTVQQDDFGDLWTADLSGTTQTQHVLRMLPPALVPHAGLAGEERLEAFALKTFQNGNSGEKRVSFTARCMSVFTENTGYIAYQFFVSQWPVTAYLVNPAKAAG